MSRAIRVIDAQLVRRLCEPAAVRGWMREAMVATSAGQAVLPLRQALTLPDGKGRIGVMAGHLAPARAAGVKLVSLVPVERRRGSSHLGLAVLYDEDGLLPLALLCGATVTALRTAAVSALATEHLARPESRVLAILGTGEQAEAHLQALRALMPFSEARVWGRRPEAAHAFAQLHGTTGLPVRACADAAQAVDGADVVCTVTASPTPILMGRWLRPGMHVNLIGSSTPDAAEADDEAVARSRFFVDYRASTMAQTGELLGAIARRVVTAEHVQGEIGEVIARSCPGRRSDDDITVYKSLGIAAQDVMTARRVFDLASDQGLGQLVHL